MPFSHFLRVVRYSIRGCKACPCCRYCRRICDSWTFWKSLAKNWQKQHHQRYLRSFQSSWITSVVPAAVVRVGLEKLRNCSTCFFNRMVGDSWSNVWVSMGESWRAMYAKGIVSKQIEKLDQTFEHHKSHFDIFQCVSYWFTLICIPRYDLVYIHTLPEGGSNFRAPS